METHTGLLTLPPSTLAIVWPLNEAWKNRPPPYYELNTLFDGALERTYAYFLGLKNAPWGEMFYFQTESFGHGLHLFCTPPSSLAKQMKSIGEILVPLAQGLEAPRVVIIGPSKALDPSLLGPQAKERFSFSWWRPN